MDTAFAISAFVTFFVIVDPIGLTPIFIALTQGMDAATRRHIALRACLIAVVILTLFGLAGEEMLAFVGISMPAFRISGGILLFVTAFDMLFERRTERREHQAEETRDDPSIFPMAMPLIAGAGAMTSIILLIDAAEGDLGKILTVYFAMFLVVAMVFLLALMAGLFERILGKSGIKVVTRLLGMLLAALAVQFVLDGLREFGLVAG